MKHYSLLLLLSLLFCFSCSDDEIGDSNLDTSIPENLTDLDNWLRDVYTYPFNVEVKYKWQDYESDITRNLVPPYENRVQPLMDVMDKVWVQCYEQEGGETFIKSYIPKLIFLSGSPGVNPEGTVTQGTAEAGRKIVLYDVNNFDADDAEGINDYFHVMHHEFAHILHQTKLYPTDDYESISAGDYRSDWYNISDDNIEGYLGLGFVTPYSMSSRDEDFVEVIAAMLTRTNDEWEEYITQEGADSTKLRAKENIVSDYFSTQWSIDIYDLQELIASTIVDVTNNGTTTKSTHSHSDLFSEEKSNLLKSSSNLRAFSAYKDGDFVRECNCFTPTNN